MLLCCVWTDGGTDEYEAVGPEASPHAVENSAGEFTHDQSSLICVIAVRRGFIYICLILFLALSPYCTPLFFCTPFYSYMFYFTVRLFGIIFFVFLHLYLFE